MTIQPQYIVDNQGQYQKVVLTIDEYNELVECAQDIIDARLIDEVKENPSVKWQKVKAKNDIDKIALFSAGKIFSDLGTDEDYKEWIKAPEI